MIEVSKHLIKVGLFVAVLIAVSANFGYGRQLIDCNEFRAIYLLETRVTTTGFTIEVEAAPEYEYTVLSEGPGAIILEGKHFEERWYEVVSRIATNLIPHTVRGLCVVTLRNPRACQAVYALSSAMVDAYEDEIRSGIEGGLQWVANKAQQLSTGTIFTESLEDAQDTQEVFNFYKEQECFEWNQPNIGTTERPAEYHATPELPPSGTKKRLPGG